MNEWNPVEPQVRLFDQYVASFDRQPIIFDSHESKIANRRVASVDDACEVFFTSSPGWLIRLMQFRNKLVGRFGFASGDHGPPQMITPIPIGHQMSVFTVIDRSDSEILLGVEDDRITMRLGIEVSDGRLSLRTAAYNKDSIGRAYLTVVKVPHGPIAASMMRRIAHGETP